MRGKVKNRNIPGPDHVYQNEKVSKLVNYVMERGKKNAARKIVYGAFDDIKKNTKQEPVEVFEQALQNVAPSMEVRSRRIGGANYQVPREVRPERQLSLALRWLVGFAKAKKGRPMHTKLAEEISLAAKGEGEAVKKRENVHKMAEANKAFAHFSW